MYALNNNVTYFDCFRVEHVSNFKSIFLANSFRI